MKLFLFPMPGGAYAIVGADSAVRAAQWLDDEWAPPIGKAVRLDLLDRDDETFGLYFDPKPGNLLNAVELDGDTTRTLKEIIEDNRRSASLEA